MENNETTNSKKFNKVAFEFILAGFSLILALSVYSVGFNVLRYRRYASSSDHREINYAPFYRNTYIMCLVYSALSLIFLISTIIYYKKKPGTWFFIVIIAVFTPIVLISLLFMGALFTDWFWIYVLPYACLLTGTIVQMAYNPKPPLIQTQYVTQVVIKDIRPSNCPNCGAAITKEKCCPFCGTRLQDDR